MRAISRYSTRLLPASSLCYYLTRNRDFPPIIPESTVDFHIQYSVLHKITNMRRGRESSIKKKGKASKKNGGGEAAELSRKSEVPRES